jgi:hypothetical protein
MNIRAFLLGVSENRFYKNSNARQQIRALY